jgi:hypothetical protein
MALTTLTLTLAAPASDGGAQPAQAPAVDDAFATEDAAVLVPELGSDAVQLQSLAELSTRNRRFTRRVRGYGFGLLIGGVGLFTTMRAFCVVDCEGRFTTKGKAAVGSILSVMILGSVVSLTGLITAGGRRHRGLRRIDALTVAPVVALGPERAGGATLALTW